MENYKRLTFKRLVDPYNNDCEEAENASAASYDELLNRLAELEDKIENGTLVEVESTCTKEEFDYICKYYEKGLCHLSKELFGTPPQPCHHINDFENCMGSKPAKHEPCLARDKIKDFVELSSDNLSEIDWISIKGIRFIREKG